MGLRLQDTWHGMRDARLQPALMPDARIQTSTGLPRIRAFSPGAVMNAFPQTQHISFESRRGQAGHAWLASAVCMRACTFTACVRPAIAPRRPAMGGRSAALAAAHASRRWRGLLAAAHAWDVLLLQVVLALAGRRHAHRAVGPGLAVIATAGRLARHLDEAKYSGAPELRGGAHSIANSVERRLDGSIDGHPDLMAADDRAWPTARVLCARQCGVVCVAVRCGAEGWEQV